MQDNNQHNITEEDSIDILATSFYCVIQQMDRLLFL